MKKKWIVMPSLLVLAMAGAFAASPSDQLSGGDNTPEPKVAVDRAARQEVIDTLVAKLNEHYIFPDKARQFEAALRQRQREGKYDAVSDSKQLAKQLTQDMLAVFSDKHMEVYFSPEPVPADDTMPPPPATRAEWEQRIPADRLPALLQMADRSVEQKHLTPRIGYLKVTRFPPR